jgi:hypothetical protein
MLWLRVRGDCFVYWQKTRGVEFPEALNALAQIAGLTSMNGSAARTPAPIVRKPQEPEKLADPLAGRQLETWRAAVDALRGNEATQQRLAEWRGYSSATVRWAVDHGLIGVMPFLGAIREVFLVERPFMDGEQARQIGVGYHVRLGPRTAHNDSDKPSWRYVPQGIGAWPFVMGHVRSAKVLFFLEGQWDALALVDALFSNGAEGTNLPPGVAVIGMRGATSWKRFVASYQWPEEAVAFALGQADEAGRGWFSEGNLIDALRPLCKRVWAFWPSGPKGFDFNDLWKQRLVNGDELKAVFREKMRRRGKGRRNPGITFFQFCRREKVRTDAVGSVARLVLADTRRPRGRKPLRDWERFLTRYVPEETHPAFYLTWKEWSARRHEDAGTSKSKEEVVA